MKLLLSRVRLELFILMYSIDCLFLSLSLLDRVLFESVVVVVLPFKFAKEASASLQFDVAARLLRSV